MTETEQPLGARVYQLYLKNLEDTPGLDPKEALADAYRKIHPQKDIQDFMSDVNDSLWYTKNIRKKIHDLINFKNLFQESNLEHITFTEVSGETSDFITEDALSLKPWMERWKSAHFFAPDLPLSKSATAGKKESTNIAWIGYDKKQLRVGFKNGWVYEYDVEPKFYTYMAGAPSKGVFLWNYLRGRSPGRVIDKPWKITPGGVGGSIVPYNKIAGRSLPERQIKRLQKKFGGEIKRGTQLKEVSKIRARKAEIRGGTSKIPSGGQQALIQKLEKRYKRDFDTSKPGRWITIKGTHIYVEKGQSPKEALTKKFGSLKKTSFPKPDGKKSTKKDETKKSFEKKQAKLSYKDVKNKVKHLDKMLNNLRKKMDAGDKIARKDYYILLKYRNRLADEKFKLKGEILFPKHDFEDAIPVKGHYRNIGGHQIYIPEFERKGEKKKEVIGTAKEKGKTPLPEAKKLKTSKSEAVIKKWLAERRGEKPSEPPKKSTKKSGLAPKERIRKEIEQQARGIKKQPAPDKREEAVQKLIEQTGYDRKRAEAEISKQFGPSKEEAATKEKQKKVQERTQQQVKQKQQQLQHSVLKLQILNQRNFKSEALKNILQLFTDLLTGKGKNIIQASRRFKRNYTRLQRDQRISLQKKSALLGVINRLNTEIQGLSAPQKDFELSDTEKGKGWHGESERHSEVAKKGSSEKVRIRKEIKEAEEDVKILSMALLGTSNPEKESPGIYHELLKARAKVKRLKLELKMTPEQLKKLRIHYGMGVSGAELTRAYKGLSGKKGDFEVSDAKMDLMNSVEDRWITKKGRHIWIENNYTPEEFYEAHSLKGEQKYLTKKEISEINYHAELSPWLKIDRGVDLKTSWSLVDMNNALDSLPLSIKNMIKEVKVYNRGVGEDPHFLGRQNEVPTAYAKVGLKTTWRTCGGCYIPNENRAIIGLRRGYGYAHVLRHEVGHAVWEKLSGTDKWDFERQFGKENKRVRDKWGDYEANDVQELFAESFARYWDSKDYKQKQRQKLGWISRFFNTRMQKYFKEE